MQHVGAPALEIVHQNAGGGDAVHIIVPEHRHAFAAVQCPADALHRLVHVRHQEGAEGQPVLPFQKCGGLLRRLHPAGGQHSGHQIGVARRLQALLRLRMLRRNVPFAVFHGVHLPLVWINRTFVPR